MAKKFYATMGLNGNFENRKKYADEFKEMIDTYYEGKCYYTKEEWNIIKKDEGL